MTNSLLLLSSILIGEHVIKQYIIQNEWDEYNKWSIVYRIMTVCSVFYCMLWRINAVSFKSNILIVLVCSLIYVAYIDIYTQKIPNAYIVILFCLWGISLFWHNNLFLDVAGAIVVSVIMLLTYFLTRGGIGAGDIKLMTIIGLYVGFFHVVAVLFWICSVLIILSIGLLVLKKVTLKTVLPMGPFIAIGTILYIQQYITLLVGE